MFSLVCFLVAEFFLFMEEEMLPNFELYICKYEI